MSWYVRSQAPGDVHRDVVNEGSVRAACGLEFFSAKSVDLIGGHVVRRVVVTRKRMSIVRVGSAYWADYGQELARLRGRQDDAVMAPC